MYRNILRTIAKVETSKLKKELENCICFSVQQDGSLDKRQRDNKYMTVRFNDEGDVCDVKTRFIGVTTSDIHGAGGLLDAFKTALHNIGLDEETIMSKLIGVTTDGESANTGKN